MKKLTTLAFALLLTVACTSTPSTPRENDNQTSREMPGATQHEPEAPTEAMTIEESLNLDENAAVFNLSTEDFKFMMDGQENPELRIKEGQTVAIILTNSSEGFHGWKVDEFTYGYTPEISGNGSSTSTTFVADKKGEFEYYCPVGNHREMGMRGKLIVE